LNESGVDIADDCARMCDIMMTRDDKMRGMVKKHFEPADYFAVRDHMIGTGMIGGKACGMLLARAIIRNSEPDINDVLEPHDSFYVGSDVYYTYIVDNGLWDLRIKQRTDAGYFALAGEFSDKIKKGSFSEEMRRQFIRIIEYYGQDPYIIRSSSILEDGFGNAFAGKYESVFCANRGSLEERLDEFEKAIKTVYASSMSLSALDYRKRRGLDKPEKTSYSSSADKHKFSQGKAEVINMAEHSLEKVPFYKIEPVIPDYLGKALLEHDYEAEDRLQELGRWQPVRFISCKGLVENRQLMEQMRRMMRCIQDEYDYPVDTEFTINFSEDGEYSVDLLQCRPLQIQKSGGAAAIPEDVHTKSILLESKGATMGMSKASKLDTIVYVDPVNYYNMPYKNKPNVAKLIGRINWYFRDAGRHMMLIVPGRVGTSSPELGVPTAFSDISAFEIICETEESKAGYNPELSYGSHIFQDLVEAEILYTAVFNNEKTLRYAPEKLAGLPDKVREFEGGEELADIVHVYDVSETGCTAYNDMASGRLLITL
ncbi:MAG: phosphoenolpyruvate synthase, partial [Firmicutes bacterium]|nr:phosphoenolpyruvate synthase [Bacillota bacterium]